MNRLSKTSVLTITLTIGLSILSSTPRRSCADELKPLTSLTDLKQKFTVPSSHHATIKAAGIEAVIVDNHAVDDDVLSGHRAGYSGIAKLTHKQQPDNLFVGKYAGLNYEHIHDGTKRNRKVLFEPRNSGMELRVINKDTVDLYQPPTPNYGLESCLRYRIMTDGVIEMTLECIPRQQKFTNGYIGLFWASYINKPQSLDIHFLGHRSDLPGAKEHWVRGVTPKHGTLSTHVGSMDSRKFVHDSDFPLTLVFNRSKYVYTQPWYYGVNKNMALVFMFRPQDQIRLTQSPSGGGQGNPAWDFQYFIPKYKVGKTYQMVMRAMYVPFESSKQIERVTRSHRVALGIPLGK